MPSQINIPSVSNTVKSEEHGLHVGAGDGAIEPAPILERSISRRAAMNYIVSSVAIATGTALPAPAQATGLAEEFDYAELGTVRPTMPPPVVTSVEPTLPVLFDEWCRVARETESDAGDGDFNARYQALQRQIAAARPTTARDVAIQIVVETDEGGTVMSRKFYQRMEALARTPDADPPTDPAIEALRRYRRMEAQLTAAYDAGDVEVSGIPYRQAFEALGKARPTTWAGLAGLLQFLAEEVCDGTLGDDDTQGRILLNIAAAARGEFLPGDADPDEVATTATMADGDRYTRLVDGRIVDANGDLVSMKHPAWLAMQPMARTIGRLG